MKEILENLKYQLIEELPELEVVELNYGQLSDNEVTINFPCVLIDLEKIKFSKLGSGYQIAEAEITMLLAVNRPDTAEEIVDPYQLYSLADKIHEVVNMYSNGEFTPLFRQTIEKIEGGENYHGYKIIYNTTYTVSYDDDKELILINTDNIDLNFA